MEFNEEFRKQIEESVIDWGARHPIDVLWRREFKIPFGSEQHLKTSFIDQLFWFEEKKMINKMISEESKKSNNVVEDSEENERVIESGEQDFKKNSINVVQMTDEEIDEEFENINIKELMQKDLEEIESKKQSSIESWQTKGTGQ